MNYGIPTGKAIPSTVSLSLYLNPSRKVLVL